MIENELSEEQKDELASLLLNLAREFEREDEDAHRSFFQEALKSEFYWTNRQHTYWNSKADGYAVFDPWSEDDYSEEYVANIFRPNGESIIAAMSAALPKLDFYPDDAENADDLMTAEAFKRIALLIQKHNCAPILVIRILFILYNQHFCAVYNYNHKSKKYGTWPKETYQDQEQTREVAVCPQCGQVKPEETCPSCGFQGESTVQVITEKFPLLVGYSDAPKSREIIKAFGPLHVRVAPYIQDQEDSPYLILDLERHRSIAKKEFSAFANKIKKGTHSDSDYYAQYRSEIYKGDCEHLDRWKLVWIRNWMYECLEENQEEWKEYLKTNFPDGIKATFVNDILVDIDNQDMDDCWTISSNPLSTYIYGEPIGKPGIPIQDATNELLNISMDTIKHGIPINFVDSETLDFNKFQQTEVKPGMTFPIKVPSNRGINDLLATTRTATLSQEVEGVSNKLQQFSQFTVGAFPSVYGGVLEGSRTASEYSQSRVQALQRLSNTWTILKNLWSSVFSKASTSFARSLEYDEKEVQKQGSGFINVWIRRSQLTGKVGSVEPEIDEQLPTSWAQIRDVLLRLIEINSPMINQVLSDPDNSTIIKNGLGLRDVVIPGYKDKLKQLTEIQEMINGNPVMPDQILDNHGVEASICRSFLIGEVGQDLKRNNPPAYEMIMQHYQQHMQILAMQQPAPAQQDQNQGANPAGAEK